MANLVAVVVEGPRNLTRITPAGPNTPERRDRLAEIVSQKDPSRVYYLAAVDESTWGTRWKEPIMVWHVGEGFTHEQGWWIDL